MSYHDKGHQVTNLQAKTQAHQAEASARKRARRKKNREVLAAEAQKLGITVEQLLAQKSAEVQTVVARETRLWADVGRRHVQSDQRGHYGRR